MACARGFFAHVALVAVALTLAVPAQASFVRRPRGQKPAPATIFAVRSGGDLAGDGRAAQRHERGVARLERIEADVRDAAAALVAPLLDLDRLVVEQVEVFLQAYGVTGAQT